MLQPLTFALPPDITLRVSRSEFTEIAAANPDLRLEQTADGRLLVSPPTGGESGKRNLSIAGHLDRWCEAHGDLGEGFDSSTGFELPNGAIRAPDAAWVRRDRWDALSREEQEGFVPLCPDFVIELRSRSDSLGALRDKMLEYQANGTRLGWLIDPLNRRVDIYRSGQDVETLDHPSELSGEAVLPGFTLSLHRIWT